ncbi:MAG: glycosyltransferase [Chlamydiota bacterium]
MKMEAPRVTVAIPCGDGERYIGESIRSVLCQTHRNIEVLVMDQQSTDRTHRIAEDFHDPRLTVLRNPVCLSIGANWNQGLRHGSGPYVIIHHQDDVMTPDSIARKVSFFEAHPQAGFVYSRVEVIDGEGMALPDQRRWFSNALFDGDHLFESLPFFMALLLGKNLICCPGVMMKRSAALGVGGFNEEMPFTLDWEMWLRMAAAYPVGYVDAVTMCYRVHRGMDSLKHVDQIAKHSYAARLSAVTRSTALLDRWASADVCAEIVSLVRQIEERSPQPRGLEILAPPVSEPVGAANGSARIRELIGPIRDPRDRVAALLREVARLDADREALRGRVKEYEESASFRLGRLLLAPVRWIRRTRDR